LYANRIKAEGGVDLCRGLVSLKNLESFGLDLFFNNITVVGVQEV